MWTVAQGCSSPVPPDITASDPVLTQNRIGAGRAGRKQWKIRRANGGKKHKSEPKRLRFVRETTCGPAAWPRTGSSHFSTPDWAPPSCWRDCCSPATSPRRPSPPRARRNIRNTARMEQFWDHRLKTALFCGQDGSIAVKQRSVRTKRWFLLRFWHRYPLIHHPPAWYDVVIQEQKSAYERCASVTLFTAEANIEYYG